MSIIGLNGYHDQLLPPNPPPPAQRPPADPRGAGLRPDTSVERGPNDFQLGIDGPNPNLAVGGSTAQQDHQQNVTLALAPLALSSYLTGHLPGAPRVPPDSVVRNILGTLNPNPPIGEDGKDVTHAVYQSHIPNATAAAGYEHFVDNPGQVFGAGGIDIRPPTDHLVDGGRYMLEIGAPVPTWLPVQISLDPTAHSIGIQTLDGHVLRGTQTFTFTNDGNGGTVLTQDARFQASSPLVGDLQQITSVAEGQHETWQYAHREIYEYFNGNPDYKGLGTDAFDPQQLSAWTGALRNILQHPGTAADVLISSTGELSKSGLDGIGYLSRQALNTLHIPGGDEIDKDLHKLGDGVSWVFDKAGGVAKSLIHDAGRLLPWNW